MTSRTRALAVSAIALMGAFVVTASDVAAAQTLSRPAEAPSITPRTVNFSNSAVKAAGVLVLPLSGAGDLAKRGAGLETATRQAIERALRSAAFGYGARQTLTLRGLGDWDRVVVVGLGASAADPQWSGAVVGRALVNDSAPVTVLTGGLPAETVAAFATGMGIGHYRSDLYQAGRRSAAPGGPVTLITDFPDAARSSFQARGLALVEAMTWARDVSNEPANVIYPETFVDRARAAFAGVPGVRIEVLDVPAMARLGMGALLGVGQGSERPPRLLVVRYQGQGAPEGGPIALVGKGITFDSGGISIKAAAGMGNMKMDMSGAAAVTASVLALARSKAPVDKSRYSIPTPTASSARAKLIGSIGELEA